MTDVWIDPGGGDAVKRAVGLCAVPDCNSPLKAGGLCGKHYLRRLRTGSVDRKTWAGGRTPEGRFWPYVSKSEQGCWLWTGVCNSKGYGRVINHDGAFGLPRNTGAHRFSWCLHFGLIPDGLLVCHKCDTPLCVRPDHLFLGTALDNTRDAISKGRFRTGRAGRVSTITPDLRREIVRLIFE